VEVYLREARCLLSSLEERSADILTMTPEEVLEYLVSRRSSGLSSTTMARVVSSVRSLFKYLRLEGLRSDDPSELIETPRLERALPDVLALKEIEKLLNSVDVSDPGGMRDRALFELIYSCGLRISEAAGLTFDSLFLKERILRVVGKRRKGRIVPFGEDAARWLTAYLETGNPACPSSSAIHSRSSNSCARSLTIISFSPSRSVGHLLRFSVSSRSAR